MTNKQNTVSQYDRDLDDCSALSLRPTCCTNGFPVTGACYGGITAGNPICMQEEVCGRLYNDNGGKPVPGY